MIKTCKVFILFLLLSLSAYSQKKFEREWNVGIGGGPTFSSVDIEEQNSSNGLKTKNMLQFHGGVSVRYLNERNVGFIAEINYSQQGWEEDFSKRIESEGALSDSKDYVHKHKLNYVEIPFLTHIYFGDKFRFFFNLGPKISYMVSESEEISQDLIDLLSSGNLTDGDITNQYFHKAEKSIDYGIMGGGGFEFRTKNIGSFSLEGRYYYGLGDIYKNKKSDFFQRSANRVISVKLTYYVKLF